MSMQIVSHMEIFQPSIFLAIFPYLFIGSFPVFGLILVTKWIIDDVRKKRRLTLKI
jgi:hypothetical protein